MKPIIINIIIFYGLLISCYKPYDPGIVATDTILVVDGMITDEVASYHIRLSYALPFDSKVTFKPFYSALIYVSDDLGNQYPFKEVKIGSYKSDSLHFTGQPGRTYTLHIETSDGDVYVSDSQRLETKFYTDSIFAEAEYQKTISRFNQVIVTVRGANIMMDIKSITDTLPHFRFTSNMVKQYFYTLNIPPPSPDPPLYSFFCWQTENSNSDINLINKEYSVNSSLINRHGVYFLDDQMFLNGIVYGLGSKQPDLSYKGAASDDSKSYTVSRRILYLNQYILNNDTYLYYKSMDELLRSEGKLFDPIASQLRGNIKCTSDPDKKVFGFFEASSVGRTSYTIGFRMQQDQYPIKKIPYILPPEPNGCRVNKAPPFWIY